MSDTSRSIWREDEGHKPDVVDVTRPEKGPDLFGDALPARDPQQPKQAESVSLWREDEGRPSHAARLPAGSTVATVPRRKKVKSTPQAKAGRFSWSLVIPITLLLLAIAIGVDGAFALLNVRDGLETVADRLDQVEQHVSDGDLVAAKDLAMEASSASAEAADAAERPSLLLGSLVPEVNRETDALDAAVRAAELSADAAIAIVQSAETLELDDEGVPTALYVDGRVQLDTVAAARQQINAAEISLTEAALVLEGLDPRLAQLREPIDEARSRIGEALARVTDGRTAFDLLPSLLGGKQERRYLLAFQAPGEARGTGGLVGLAAVLTADDGRFDIGAVRPYNQIVPPSVRGIEAPDWFSDSYGAQAALTEWPQANVSPNYPAVSEVLLDMYQKGTGERLDGVIAMDPIALAGLMKATDPIETTDPQRTIDADNVADVLLVESYTEFSSPEAQNAFLSQIVDGFWGRVSSGDIDLETFADAMGEAIRTQHIKIYSSHRSDQTHIETLDLDGNYDTAGGAAQMVFNVNYAANKIDYFLHRSVDTAVELQSDGTAEVTTVIEMENRAPSGPPSVLLGRDTGLPPGVNRMTLNFLMPPNALVERFEVGGEERAPFLYRDDRSPVAWDLIQIPPGGSETVTLTYSMPAAVQILGEGTVFDFTMFPQTTVNPDTYSLTVTPPPGADLVSPTGPEGIERSGTLDEPVSIRMQMESD